VGVAAAKLFSSPTGWATADVSGCRRGDRVADGRATHLRCAVFARFSPQPTIFYGVPRCTPLCWCPAPACRHASKLRWRLLHFRRRGASASISANAGPSTSGSTILDGIVRRESAHFPVQRPGYRGAPAPPANRCPLPGAPGSRDGQRGGARPARGARWPAPPVRPVLEQSRAKPPTFQDRGTLCAATILAGRDGLLRYAGRSERHAAM